MDPIAWHLVPAFLREAIKTFPFGNQSEAQEFLCLLNSRLKSVIGMLPDSNEGTSATDWRSDAGWDLHAEMVQSTPFSTAGSPSHAGLSHQMAGAQFLGRCVLCNWLLEIPTLYREVYMLSNRRVMFDRDRVAALRALLTGRLSDKRVPSDPDVPWIMSPDDKNEPLHVAVSHYRSQVGTSM